nr:polysaccharide deacetylase family protein [uncultured Bacillus sp.]
MNRKERFQARKKKRFRRSVYRFILSVLFVLLGSMIYDNMNLDAVFKGIFANDEIETGFVEKGPSVTSVISPLLLHEKYIYSKSFAQDALENDLRRNHIFIGNYYNNIKTEMEDSTDPENSSLNDQENFAGNVDSTSQPEQGIQEEAVADSGLNEKTVYLTFDDGPNQFSGQLLALLESYHAKATFFMIDRNIRNFPDAVNKMVSLGHSVGLHSVSHNVKIFYQSAANVISEMNQVRSTVKEVSGVDTMLIRTPYGSVPHMQDSYVQAVRENGFLMWDWNIDSKDWYYRDYRFVENCIAQLEVRSDNTEPIVILLHEKEETLAQLPALLDYLTDHNYVMDSIDASMTPVTFN